MTKITGYTWYVPGDAPGACLTACLDGAPVPKTLGDLMKGHGAEPKQYDDLFDITLYGNPEGTEEERGWYEESRKALELVVETLNAALDKSVFKDAFARIERMTEEAEARIPRGSEYEAMEEHGYIEALNDVTNMLHLLALGQTPAQGSEPS
jgi:hypothetical protein